jgi:tetratricopeptide (TPR) repeat protein
MQFIDLISSIEPSLSQEEIRARLFAFRSDPVIWQGLLELSDQPQQLENLKVLGKGLTPGSLAMAVLNTKLDLPAVGYSKLAAHFLEDLLQTLENYIQDPTGKPDLLLFAKLAAVLIEKARIGNGWGGVIDEIIHRMKIKDAAQFTSFWGTVFGIIINLIAEKDELLSALLSQDNPFVGLEAFLHTVMSLPVDEEARINLFEKHIAHHKPEFQAQVLRTLSHLADKNQVRQIALRLLQKHQLIDLNPQSASEYWNNLESSMQMVLGLQAITEMASFAGDTAYAEKTNQKSLDVLEAVSAISKIHQSEYRKDCNESSEQNTNWKDLQSPDISRELMYVDIHVTSEESEIQDETIRLINQSKQMITGGNGDLAGEELREIFPKLTDEDIRKIILDGPRFTTSWDPMDVIQLLVKVKCEKEALRVTELCLEKKPADSALNELAYELSKLLGLQESVLKYSQFLHDLEPGNGGKTRALAKAFALNGDYFNASRVSKTLLDTEGKGDLADLLTTAEYCLKMDENTEALMHLKSALGLAPEDAHALSLTGLALKNLGDFEQSMNYLERSVQLSGDDPEAWRLLSELLWQNGNKEAALQKLKEGMAACPGVKDLEIRYADRLIESGSIADAYPILKSWSEKKESIETDLMLLDVMKRLGSPELEKVGLEISERYPEDARMQAALGTIFVLKGKREAALPILKKAKVAQSLTPESSIAYLQALINWKYSDFNFRPSCSRVELLEAFSLLKALIDERATFPALKLVQGETYLAAKDYSSAFEIFANLLQRENDGDPDVRIRMNAGLALSSCALKKFDLAEAAIQECLTLEPEFAGVRRLAAETFAESGQTEKALSLAGMLYESAAEDPLRVSWYADMLRKFGEDERAEIVVSKAIARNPKKLSLVLELAEPRWLSGDQQKATKGLEAVKPLLEKAENAYDLVRAANGFETIEDVDMVSECLNRAAATGDLAGVLNLAGYYRRHNDLDMCCAVLEDSGKQENLFSLLLAETLGVKGRYAEAIQIMEQTDFTLMNVDMYSPFFPEEWKTILQTREPARMVRLTLLARQGQFDHAFQMGMDWLNQTPDDLDTRAATIECALGAGKSEEINGLVDYETCLSNDLSVAHFRMLRNEFLLDKGDLALIELAEDVNDEVAHNILDRITDIRVNLLGGDIPGSEKAFDWVINAEKALEELPFLQRLSGLRSLFKAAGEIARWKNALTLYQTNKPIFKGHIGILVLAINILVEGLEFGNRFETLALSRHMLSTEEKLEAGELLSELLMESEGFHIPQSDILSLRGKIALDPRQEYIRKLATYPPNAKGAAAMMSALRRSGQNEIAVKIARKFQDDTVVLFELARSLEDPTKTKEALNKILDIDPENIMAYRMLSSELSKQGDKQGALEALETALSYWPNEENWQTDAAEKWADLGNYENQISHLRTALETNPEDEELHVRIGKAMVAVHELDEGLEFLKIAAHKNPNRADVWVAIADAHEAAGDLGEALIAAQKAAEIDEFSSTPRIISARIHLKQGNLDTAFVEAQKAVEVDPGDAENYIFLSRVHLENNDKQAALAALEKASACENATLETMLKLAQLMKELNGAGAARNLLEQFSQRYPENHQLLILLAEAEEECGNLEYAQSVSRRALTLKPEDPVVHRLVGKIQEKSGNLDQAALSFSKAIAYDPQNVDGYLDLSEAFYQQREYEKAREVLSEGIDRNARDVRLYLGLANIARESKDYKLAEEMLRKAAELEPRNLNVHRQLGAVLALNMIQHSQEVSVHS